MRRLAKVFEGSSERGASAILVALLMAVLLGAAGLAIDLGASYAKKQELQNGADAAALAMGQKYAFEDDPCEAARISEELTSEASGWISQNVITDSGSDATVECDGLEDNELRVIADGTQEHWFMAIFGYSESPIQASAAVEFGVPGEIVTSPLTIANCAFLNEEGTAPNKGDNIVIWPPGPSGTNGLNPDDPSECSWHNNYPPGGFGVVAHNEECEAEVTQPMILHSAPGGSLFDSPCLAALVEPGVISLVPLFDESTGDGNNATYHVMRFAAIDIAAINLNNPNYGSPGCPTGSKPDWTWNNGKYCLIGTFVDFVSLQDYDGELELPEDGDTVVVVRLTD